MQVREGVPGIAQARGGDAGEWLALHGAAGGLERADVVELRAAVAQIGIAVAGGAALGGKQCLAGLAGRGHAAIAVAIGAGSVLAQAVHVGGQGVEVGRQALFLSAQRVVAVVLVEAACRHQAGATFELDDLCLEVLHLVEVAAPVQALLLAAMAHQRDGLAQPFAQPGHVPDAAVAVAFAVAAGAAHVVVAGQAGVAGIVKELLAAQDLGGQAVGTADGFHQPAGDGHAARIALRHQGTDVQEGQGALHDVGHHGLCAVGRDGHALRGHAHRIHPAYLYGRAGIDDGQLA